MEQHPYDMPREEFMALPEADPLIPRMTPLRSRHDPTGIVDRDGRVWVPVRLDDGTWGRQQR